MQHFNHYLSNSLNNELMFFFRAINEKDFALAETSLMRLYQSHRYIDWNAFDYWTKQN